MNKIIIEIPKFRDITLKVNTIGEAIKKLLDLENISEKRKTASIEKFKGIAKYKMDAKEEEWYLQ